MRYNDTHLKGIIMERNFTMIAIGTKDLVVGLLLVGAGVGAYVTHRIYKRFNKIHNAS